MVCWIHTPLFRSKSNSPRIKGGGTINSGRGLIAICVGCEKEITEEEAETYSGMCRECYEIEIIELDLESEES